MRKRLLAFLLFCFSNFYANAQSLPPERRSDWQNAGRPTAIPEYSISINIQDFGALGDSLTLNEIPFQQAVEALQGKPGVIFFPPGKYLFHHPIYLRDSLIIRGESSEQTLLLFDLGSIQQNCMVSRGALEPDGNAYLLNETVVLGDTSLQVQSNLAPGDLVRFQFDDSLIVFSDWARGMAGQILIVQAANSSQIQVNHPLRIAADLALRPRLRKIDPIYDAGIECLKIKRLDPNVPLGSNVLFEHSRRCWLLGVESEICNFAHFCFDGSTQCEIYGCYIHDAFAFGGGGEGYGVVFQNTAGDNRAQNNIFKHLRHSMLIQSGANSNVLGYNFSTEPTWEEFPNDGAGEIAIHGNFPSYNLFEGNVCKNIRPDGSHGNNGPYNTLFRNRTTGYGLIVTAPEYQHSLNVLGNEIVAGGLFQGIYLIGGSDPWEAGNSQNNQITPTSSAVQKDTSLYFENTPHFLHGVDFLIGPPSNYMAGKIPAETRFNSNNIKTDCDGRIGIAVNNIEPLSEKFDLSIFPNPASTTFTVSSIVAGLLEIFDIKGQKWHSTVIKEDFFDVNCAQWPAGIYVIRMKTEGKSYVKMLIKSTAN